MPPVLIVVAVAALFLIFTLIARYRQTQKATPDRTELFALQNTWRAPAELLASPMPRPIKLSGQGKTALVAAVVLFAGGCGLSVVVVRAALQGQERLQLLQQEGTDTEGEITGKRVQRGSKSTTHYLTYRFEADGLIYQRQAAVNREAYDHYQTGDRVQVRYVRSRPEISRLALERSGLPVWTALLPPAFFVLMVMLMTTPIVVQRRLLQWGQPTGAMVTRITPVKGGKSVRYEFLDMGGNPVAGSSTVTGLQVPEISSVVTILHDPQNPRRNTLYPPQLVKLA